MASELAIPAGAAVPQDSGGGGASRASGHRALTLKLAALFGRPTAKAAVALFWLCLVVGGLLVAKVFMAELKSSVPPVPGSKSDEAQRATDRYFPERPIQGALLCESSGGTPFAKFVNRSTCMVQAQATLGASGIGLHFNCSNATALGGGCIIKQDLGPQLLSQTDKVLRQVLPAKETQEALALFELLLPSILQEFPNTLCPEAVDAELTRSWLGFAAAVSAELRTRVPQCDSAVQSFLSVPPLPVERSVQLPGRNSTVNITALIPAGDLWGLLRGQLLSASGSSALLAAVTSSCRGVAPVDAEGPEAKDIAKALVAAAASAPRTMSVRVSTVSLMVDAIQNGINLTMDLSAMTLPIALIILAAMVQNMRLVICTLLNLLSCTAASIFIMYPVAKWITVSTTAPSLMIAVALAMSIDYSLFLLSRFQKEAADGRTPTEAVEVMLATSGKIVLVSGLTLLLCFLTMLCLPVTFIASLGVSAAVTVLMGVAAALTLTPVLLLTFPDFFSSSRRWGLSADGCGCCRARGTAQEQEVEQGCREMVRQSSAEEVAQRQEVELELQMRHSCWPRFGRQVQRLSPVILVVLLAIGVPVAACSLPRLSHSAGLVPFMPSDAPATRTLSDLQGDFGVGAVFPTTLLAVPPPSATATEQARAAWLRRSCEALRAVAAAVDTDASAPAFLPSAFAGQMILDGSCTTAGLGSWSNVGGPYSATQVQITYQIDPFSAEGQRWIARMRDALAKQRDVAEWFLAGEGPSQVDAAAITFAKFPLMVALMMGVVLVLMGISFRSVVAPLRAVVCLIWMLAMTFGLAVFIFQDGCLDFLHWPQLGQRASGAMSWMTPCIACSVVVGLGLDYDIFYSERVLEECGHGHSERDAAIRALAATANTISAAGVIMVIAFLSLLLCSTPTLNEIGFLLVVGVIIDCFVTTKVIIPAVMSLLGRSNFWPRQLASPCESEAMCARLGRVSDP